MSKVTNLAPFRERTLLMSSLMRSREVVLVHQSQCVAAVAVGRDSGYDTVEALCCDGGSEHVRSITGSGGFALEGQLK